MARRDENPDSKAAPTSAISLVKLTVRSDRVEALVRIDGRRYTDSRFARALVERFPLLPSHTCKNDRGPTFESVMGRTSLAHVLEHVVIQLQVQEDARHLRDRCTSGGAKAPYGETVFVGTTEWVDEDAGVARVCVNYADDLVALGAFRDGVRILNELLRAR